ncbi:YkvA family protein [Streptomyces sp. RKAG293]|uniref:DUF1232 domain-containing protein n=1 Tax=Streptomyces sp. RKAG293 TaxID=2893403 RepID=UPI0020334895|nr:YkvA family protein [Streptomyces sp. RKAG293]MCM2418180.1 DUF1232 domain-containing protein [Streptomyces sp. RKAG293]
MSDTTLVWTLAALAVVIMLVIAVRLAVRLVRVRRLLVAAHVPLTGKAMFWGAIAYLLCPVDLLPDPILIDDIGVLWLAVRALESAARRAGIGPGEPDGDRPVAPATHGTPQLGQRAKRTST